MESKITPDVTDYAPSPETAKKPFSKRGILALVAGLLAFVVLFVGIALAIGNRGKSVITMEKDGVSVSFSLNHYELLLSRWKGTLVSGSYTQNGLNAEQDAFYDFTDKFNGTDLQTLSEYYSDLILENCKTYTAVLWLFDSMGLSLSAKQIAEVDQQMQDILDAYGEGSKSKLNTILGTYGVNYKLLREMYLMEMKVNAVQDALYGSEGSMLGYEVKEEFLEENYLHFKQIFLPYFHYIYRTDKFGDEIYYLKDSDKGAIAYDTAHGFAGFQSDGTPDNDANGDQIYYTSAEQTKIAYLKDETKSQRSYVLDANGEAKTKEMTAEEIAAVKEAGEALFTSLSGCTVAEFEAAMAEKNQDGSESVYPDGYYLQKNLDYAGAGSDFAYFSDIIAASESMEAGAVAKITSDASGYHIIMKYDPTPKAYENAANEVWFKNFNSGLVEKLFLERCQALYADMTVNEKVLASASDIKKIGVNLYF